jgi:hypothetical protein
MIVLLLMGALPMDLIGAPLPIYLEDVELSAALQQLNPALNECGASVEQTHTVELSIGSNGKVKSRRWAADESPDFECWNTAIDAHVFPKHRDEAIVLKTIVYVRGERTFLSPQPVFFPREPGPLMLFLLPEDLPVDRLKEALHGEPKQ